MWGRCAGRPMRAVTGSATTEGLRHNEFYRDMGHSGYSSIVSQHIEDKENTPASGFLVDMRGL
eukprot:3593080-Amphidinium_carterae.1